jgi:hypothetical protein
MPSAAAMWGGSKNRRKKMTKKKGPKKAKLEFTIKRIERKQTRHLKKASVPQVEVQKAPAAENAPANLTSAK